jgi:hypothetical protein
MPLLETIASGAARAFGLTALSKFFDQYFNQTALLISANGSNGDSNSAFTDYSSDNVSLTKIGGTAPGSFSPYLNNYSILYNGTDTYFEVPSSTDFEFGSGDFTIEWWENPSINSTAGIINRSGTTGVNGGPWVCIGFSDGRVSFYANSGASAWDIADNKIIGYRTLGKWAHWAVTRQGNTFRGFKDGVQTITWTSSLSLNSSTSPLVIGRWDGYFNGYMSNVRLVKGTALYTENFTPSTAPLTSVSGTSLIFAKENRYTKESSSNRTVTAYGSPKITANTPFVYSSEYSQSQGASYFFDGSGDAIQLGNNAVENPDFMSWLNTSGGSKVGTIEAWVYPTALGVDTTDYEHSSFLNKGQVFFNFGVRGRSSGGGVLGTPRFYWYGAGNQRWIQSSTAIKLNEWSHIAAVLDGTSVKLYVNGVNSGGTRYTDATLSETFSAGQGGSFNGINSGGFAQSTEFYVGRVSEVAVTSSHWNGYVSNLRIVPGTQVYTSNFTPPSAPLTNISGTKLLLTAEHTKIFDATRKHNLESRNGAAVSTTDKKYGTGSLYFDGVDDFIHAAWSPEFTIGQSDYTIEFWMKSGDSVGDIISAFDPVSPFQGWLVGVGFSQSGKISFYNADSSAETKVSTASVNDNQWHHIAVTKSGTTLRIFIDGALDSTHTLSIVGGSANTSGNKFIRIGADNNGSANSPSLSRAFNGYLDDIRITKGIARYTSAFTPPQKEFDRL